MYFRMTVILINSILKKIPIRKKITNSDKYKRYKEYIYCYEEQY